MGVGILATTYPEYLTNNLEAFVLPLEKRIELPYHKTLPPILGEIGFELGLLAGSPEYSNKLDLCLFPSFFLRMHPAFEAFFLDNNITDDS
jgi:hypothetical protein